MTGSRRGAVGLGPEGPKSLPVHVADAAPGGAARIADAATVATRARRGVTSPLPSGCTRLDRNTTNMSVAGSIHREVPVNPVCPNEPTGRSSPRLEEYDESMSQPSPRTLGSSPIVGLVIFSTASGESTRAPW